MSRRDMIIIAVLLNAAVLSFLFLTATRQGGDEDFQPIYEQVISLDFPEESSKEAKGVIELEAGPRDEVDQAIKPYLTGQESPLPPIETSHDQPTQEAKVDPKQEFTEVTVKRGDVLEKIARTNGTTVKELKRFNNLPNDKISIGQVLKIPKGGTTQTAVTVQATQPAEAPSTAQYYVVKAGDNPWKIARLNKVKVEDLLTLNGLTEESARNLKVGDKIRVK